MALKQERNYGIDLLRMVAMFLVAVLHVLGQGGILKNTNVNSGQYLVGWFLELAAFTSVNLYALISGYVGINSKYRVTNIAVLWLQVFFYSFGIALVIAIFKPSVCSLMGALKFTLPVITRKYWYFSAYVVLFLFMPVLNAGVNALSKRTLRRVIIGMILVFSVAASVAKEASYDPFTLTGGYTGLWLMILYVLGAYIRKYGMWESLSKLKLIGVFFSCAVLSLSFKVLVRLAAKAITGEAYNLKFVSTFISPLVVLGSIALLLFFARLQCGNIMKKIVALFAPAAFGVYLIHVHPLIWEHLMKKRFAFLANLNPFLLAGGVLLSALGIFVVCSLIDLVRIRIFKLLKIRQLCLALESRLFGDRKPAPATEPAPAAETAVESEAEKEMSKVD